MNILARSCPAHLQNPDDYRLSPMIVHALPAVELGDAPKGVVSLRPRHERPRCGGRRKPQVRCHPLPQTRPSYHRRGPVAKKIPLLRVRSWGRVCSHAGVAELADAYGSGPYESNLMKVQLLSPAPLHADASWSNPEAFFVGSSRLCEGFVPPRPPGRLVTAKVPRPGAPPHGESAPARRAPSRRKCPADSGVPKIFAQLGKRRREGTPQILGH